MSCQCLACEAMAKTRAEAERRQTEHDSIYQRFEQLEQLLETAATTDRGDDCQAAATEALALTKLLRAQVLQ